MSSGIKLAVGVGLAAGLYLPVPERGLEQDSTLQGLIVQQATFAAMPQDAANPNAYLTPRKVSAPRIEVVQVRFSRTPVDRLLGIRSYAARVQFRADGIERCATVRLQWSASAEGWSTRNLRTGSCSSWL